MLSAATVDVSVATGEHVLVTGTTTITSLGTGFAGCYRELRFSGALTLTHSANLILPGSVNITTTTSDVYCFRCLSAGVWILVGGGRATSGTWTPTGAAVANASAVTTFAGQYQRVGNVVTCSVRVDLTCTAATVVTRVSLTLPISSDFTLSANCVGAGAANNSAVTIINPVVVNCDTATDKVNVSFLSLGAGVDAVVWVNFTYTVA